MIRRYLLPIIFVLIGLIIGLLVNLPNINAHQSIPNVFTDRIETTGSTKKIYFYMLVETDAGDFEWHYFGVDSETSPPNPVNCPVVECPIFEHNAIQFPSDLDLVSSEFDWMLYDMAIQVGLEKEGLH